MRRMLATMAIALLIVAAAGAQDRIPPPSPADLAIHNAWVAGYDAMPDLPGTGRYPAIKRVEDSLPGFTVYRPADLEGLGATKLAILVWGNGGCVADGAHARLHLLEIASHGYLAIAPGEVRSGPGAVPDPSRSPRPPGSILPPETSTADLLAALDWALAENDRAGSEFAGRIDPELVAVAGWSCGGLQALEVAADPRVRTAVIHNSGIFPAGQDRIPEFEVQKSALAGLHSPMLYILGGPGDVAHANGSDDFERLEDIPVMLADLQVGHGGTFREPYGGRAAQVALDWLEWQLRGDCAAARTFLGPACRLCLDPTWTLRRKGFDRP